MIGRGVFWLSMVLCLGVCAPASPVRDVRQPVARESLLRDPPGMTPLRRPPLRTARRLAAGDAGQPVPGGTGYGYWFRDGQLQWTHFTAIDFYAIVPDRAGPHMRYYLYLTATNRSRLGLEALVMYHENEEALFRVYDWSRNDPWQTSLNLPTDHPEYLVVQRSERGSSLRMCRIRNTTAYLGVQEELHQWRNEALLFNFTLGTWDLVYSHDYTTNTKEANMPNGTEDWNWGPIVEIWEDTGTYDVLPPLGFDRVRLFQDGAPESRWLDPSNSERVQSGALREIHRIENRGFLVYSGEPDPDGDGASIEAETVAGTDPTNAASVFRLALEYSAAASNRMQCSWESVEERAYRFRAATSVTGVWVAADELIAGTGEPVHEEVPVVESQAFFTLDVQHPLGTLCVTVNRSEAEVSISPPAAHGPLSWAVTPLGDRWDETIPGLMPMEYHVSFSPVGGMLTPPDVWVAISNGTMSHATGLYQSQ